MRIALATLLSLGTAPAAAPDIKPPPPLVDYAEASYVGISYVAVCPPARHYVFVISSPFGSGPQLQSLSAYGLVVTPEDLVRVNEKLAKLKSFTSLRIYCLTGNDMVRISGYLKATDGQRLAEVVLHFTNAGVTVD